ncbi:beta-lactamase family protein [Rhodobacteraceae bacterium D3-12]|nr:beta-lactamase family protein [Rhodobacteraceae bacterium D3-12]
MTTPKWRDPSNPGGEILPPHWHMAPYNRWSFQHMREMTPTAGVRRGHGGLRHFDQAPRDLGGLSFESRGRTLTINQFLDQSWTDGWLVLHQGKVLEERYLNGMTPERLHLSMSMAKSILGTVVGILIADGKIDPTAQLPHYLPELGETAYRAATVQHLLDMTTGVTFDESYEVPGSHMQKLGNACAWGGRGDAPGWPETIWQLVLELTEQERPHGDQFLYRSIETDVLGFVVERVMNLPLAEIVSNTLWQRIGAEEDAAYTVDLGGFALADGGFNATLRDFGRYAQLLCDGGRVGDQQVVPTSWIEETRFGKGGRFEGIYAEVMPGGGYHNKFWQVDPERGTIMCRGIYGQFIYVDPEAELAAVKLSTWPTPLDMDGALDSIAAFQALGRALGAP